MRLESMLILAAGLVSMGAHAQAPSGTTAVCSDGSYSHAKTQARACLKHGGVKRWMGADQAPAPTPAPVPVPVPHGNASTAKAPSGTTAVCADGSYSRAQTLARACGKHGGVRIWTGQSATTQATTPISGATKPAAIPTPNATQPAPANRWPTPTASPSVARLPAAPAVMPAPGGGNGMVWVNKATKVFHCQGDRWYGRTKAGAYVTQTVALAQGYHPEHGKSCP